MRIGYASKLIGVANTDMRSCILRNATHDRLVSLIEHNINSLNKIIEYNIEKGIKLFRISSDLIPFGSSDVNKIKWWQTFSEQLDTIGEKIRENNIRVSVHPGQYTVLNSVNGDAAKKAVEELIYHTRILDSLGVDSKHKVVLHIGGAYGNKRLSIERFIDNYRKLPDNVKRRLVIENDDRVYNIQEALKIGFKLSIPIIFDNLHNNINPVFPKRSELYWIKQCKKTWGEQDGNPKIHYSQQAQQKKTGSHSNSIDIDQFMSFFGILDGSDVDIMLEVKDKNLSCIKCINCIYAELDISALKDEWDKYRYSILERSQLIYEKINDLVNGEEGFSAIQFYRLVEDGLKNQGNICSYSNAALHVWYRLMSVATDNERENFFVYLKSFQDEQADISTVKNYLKRLAKKYQQDNLLSTLYFYF